MVYYNDIFSVFFVTIISLVVIVLFKTKNIMLYSHKFKNKILSFIYFHQSYLYCIGIFILINKTDETKYIP